MEVFAFLKLRAGVSTNGGRYAANFDLLLAAMRVFMLKNESTAWDLFDSQSFNAEWMSTTCPGEFGGFPEDNAIILGAEWRDTMKWLPRGLSLPHKA